MSSNSVLQAVQHYQRSIEKNSTDVARLLHCVGKLYKIPITVKHLEQTGVGRTVNALRKHEGELRVAAEAVINKWKELVASENDLRAGTQNSDAEQDINDGDDSNSEKQYDHTCYDNGTAKTQCVDSTSSKQQEKLKGDAEQSESRKDSSRNHHKTKSSSEKSRDRQSSHKNEHKDKLKGHHSSSKESHKKSEREHKSHSKVIELEKSENNKEKHRKNEHKSKNETNKIENSKKNSSSKDNVDNDNNSHGKHRHHDKHNESRDKDKEKSKSSSESKCKSYSLTKTKYSATEQNSIAEEPHSSLKNVSSIVKKRRHENEEEKDNGNSSKKSKINLHQNEKQSKLNSDNNEGEMDDGIDSSMGANFADVLGMLNMPKKKAKKTLNLLKSTSSPPKSTRNHLESNNSSSKTNGIQNKELPSSSSSTSGHTSQRKLEQKPELLTSKVKLPPLDPSIALELPIISNNYKPLPLNPTVMDCVFNSATSSSSRAPPPRLFSDAEALSHGISSKTMRTKVYSGVKTGQLLQVPSLFDLCIRVLQKNIDALEYTGGVPFDVLRPVLERATPQQLFTFEEYNPYLIEDSDVLWQQHVQRNYRGHKREEMESWREMFMRCQDDQERRLSMLAENIKQSQKAIALPVRKTQLAFVDTMVKPPRNVVRKQEQFGTKSKLVATPAARVAALSNVTPNAAKQGDARLRVAAAFAQDPIKISNAPIRSKKAPLMAKTLQFMRGRLKR